MSNWYWFNDKDGINLSRLDCIDSYDYENTCKIRYSYGGHRWSTDFNGDKAKRDKHFKAIRKILRTNRQESLFREKLIEAGLAEWQTNPKNGKPRFVLKEKK